MLQSLSVRASSGLRGGLLASNGNRLGASCTLKNNSKTLARHLNLESKYSTLTLKRNFLSSPSHLLCFLVSSNTASLFKLGYPAEECTHAMKKALTSHSPQFLLPFEASSLLCQAWTRRVKTRDLDMRVSFR